MRSFLEHPYRFVTIALVLEAVAALSMFGSGVDGLKAVARYSGRAGLFWFALVFSIAPLHHFLRSEWTRLALRRRRSLGLAFGVHHLVHLAELVFYLGVSGESLDPSRAAGGMAGYVFLLAMMVTSSDAAVARLGARNWKRLHRTGLWYLWIVFLITYSSRLAGKVPNPGGGTAEFIVCISVVLVIATLRGAAVVSRRRSSPLPAPSIGPLPDASPPAREATGSPSR